MDPYQWRESVLSTRSLSYLSTTAETLEPYASLSYGTRPRRGTVSDSESEYDLEMGGMRPEERTGGLDGIRELPESVADSLLFTLPREIRDRIYSFVLTATNNQPVEWPSLPGANLRYVIYTELTRTCNIIHDEAAPLLYSGNTLVFHHPSDANMFARAFASQPLCRRYIQNLSLHVKATDTRLWMPYFTSSDPVRNLKADFPSLRELGVRYRSHKWNHSLSPEANLKTCLSEDSKLDEVIDGLRQVFFPSTLPVSRGDGSDGVKPLNEMNEEEFMRFVDARRPGEDMAFKRQLLELHKAHAPAASAPAKPEWPVIKIVCACRVHSAHFHQVTSGQPGISLPAPPPPPPPPAPPAGVLPAAQTVTPPSPPLPPPEPVVEGEPFRGFSVADFTRVKKVQDPDIGLAKVARTPYTVKEGGILIAVEIHCLESSGRSREARDA